MPRSKYRAKPTIYNGVRYASKAEAEHAETLDILIRCKELKIWIPQPRFRLGVPENVYIADFFVVNMKGNVWVEDVKGFETAKFRRDKKLWKAYGPCALHLWMGGRLKEVIEPEETK